MSAFGGYSGQAWSPAGDKGRFVLPPAFRKAVKESSGDINRVHLLARDYPHIQLSCGMDDQALEFFAWGARSWICAGSNFLPAEHIALWRACAAEGDFDKGRRIMSAMLPLMAVLEQGGKAGNSRIGQVKGQLGNRFVGHFCKRGNWC